MTEKSKQLEDNEVKKRTIPITNGFLKKGVNDLLYSYLQTKSYIDNKKVRFCYIEYENYSELANEFSGKFSESKLRRDMKLLIQLGFVQRGYVEDLYGENVKALILPFDTKVNIYKFIPLDTLQFLVNEAVPHAIKVYAYLMNKQQGFKRYKFTKKELINQLGVKNPKQRDYEIVEEILIFLSTNGLIQYVDFYEPCKAGVTPRKRLLSVNENIRTDQSTNEKEKEKGDTKEDGKEVLNIHNESVSNTLVVNPIEPETIIIRTRAPR